MFNTSFAYAVISKENNCCIQVNKNNNPNWILDNDYCFNIPVDTSLAVQYLDKYYYNNTWWSRIWNEYEENEYGETVPVEESGYVDTPWSPINGGEVKV